MQAALWQTTCCCCSLMYDKACACGKASGCVRAGGTVADHLLLLRFQAGSCVAADVIPPDVSPSFDALPVNHSVPDVVRLPLLPASG